MDQRLAGLLRLLELERVEVNIFRGASRDIGSPQVYGGQVLGQALQAAYATVDEARVVHSLHAYFLRRGDFNAPIVYFVDRSRDGQSFTSRRVTAIQHGEQIFNCSASFQQPEPGFEHQLAMPQVPFPRNCPSRWRRARSFCKGCHRDCGSWCMSARSNFAWYPPPPRQRWLVRQAISVDSHGGSTAGWRSPAPLSTGLRFGFPPVGTGTAGRHVNSTLVEIPIIIREAYDHDGSHRPARMDDWLLYAADSPSASGARGYTRGSLFTREGVLVASTAQEGLVRVLPPRTRKSPAACQDS